MAEERFADKYSAAAAFYDGLEDHPCHYPTIYEDPAFGGLGAGYLVARYVPEPEQPLRLITPEEFMRR